MCAAVSSGQQLLESSNLLGLKPTIKCLINEDEKSHLFHQAGRITRLIRKSMFFPFSLERAKKNGLSSAKLFWETSYPDRDYPKKKEIQDHFNRFEQIIEIEENGKKLHLKCHVIEPKNWDKETLITNHLIVQGNTSNLENNTPGIVPFLESYLHQREKNPQMPLGRFIVFNHYDNCLVNPNGKNQIYLPGDIDEWGFLFKKTLESLTNEYGKFQSISAHSLGNIPIVSQFKHFSKEDFAALFPKTLFLSKGPSSMYEISKNVPFQLGVYPWGWLFLISPLLYLFAKILGWTIELDQTLVDLLKKASLNPDCLEKLKNTNIIISEVKHDYYFPGKASLCSSKKINQLEKLPLNLYRVSFDPPPTRTTKQGQHNYNPGSLQRQYIYKENLYDKSELKIYSKCPVEIFHKKVDEHHLCLRHGEALPDLVLRTSML